VTFVRSRGRQIASRRHWRSARELGIDFIENVLIVGFDTLNLVTGLMHLLNR
jgi:hypothetical protein